MRVLRPKPSPAVLLLVGSRRLRGLPVLVHVASTHVAFRQCKSVSVLIASFRSSIPSPPVPLFTLRRTPRGVQRKTRGRAVRYSFLVGLLHSLLHAGLSRRTALAILHHSRIRLSSQKAFPKHFAPEYGNQIDGEGNGQDPESRPCRSDSS